MRRSCDHRTILLLLPPKSIFVMVIILCYCCCILFVSGFSFSHHQSYSSILVLLGERSRIFTQQQRQKQHNNNYCHPRRLERSSSLSSSSSSSDKDSVDNNNTKNNHRDVNNQHHLLLQQILDVAIIASQKAGEIIKENSDGTIIDDILVEKKSTNRDLLTIVDPLCEKAIREIVLENFPNHQFLGEEQVEPGIDAAINAIEEKLNIGGWLWIVDPIDGTTNFASGIPINIPSIAISYDGEVQVGVLFDPHRDELFTAIRGMGAHLNGQRIHVGKESNLGDAVIGMESPAGSESLQQCLHAIPHLMPQCRTIRMLGSSAVMLPWVAMGRLTAYWTPDECSWDVAAGALILQEAGGLVTDFDNNNFTLKTRDLVGTNGKVHDALLHVLVEEAKLVGLVRGNR